MGRVAIGGRPFGERWERGGIAMYVPIGIGTIILIVVLIMLLN